METFPHIPAKQVEQILGIFADLQKESPDKTAQDLFMQIEDPERGFSFSDQALHAAKGLLNTLLLTEHHNN